MEKRISIFGHIEPYFFGFSDYSYSITPIQVKATIEIKDGIYSLISIEGDRYMILKKQTKQEVLRFKVNIDWNSDRIEVVFVNLHKGEDCLYFQNGNVSFDLEYFNKDPFISTILDLNTPIISQLNIKITIH